MILSRQRKRYRGTPKLELDEISSRDTKTLDSQVDVAGYRVVANLNFESEIRSIELSLASLAVAWNRLTLKRKDKSAT